jgi:hypothetical protein
MAWWPFRKKAAPQVDIPRALKYVPMRLDTVEMREDSHGMIHLKVLQPPQGFAKKVADWLHQEYSRKYELDAFGSYFYRLVDGKATLKKIAKLMYREFGETT